MLPIWSERDAINAGPGIGRLECQNFPTATGVPQRLFERLAVFAGGWTLEGAESVGAGVSVEREDILDLLAGLVRKSLVVASETADGAVHYGLLDALRATSIRKMQRF